MTGFMLKVITTLFNVISASKNTTEYGVNLTGIVSEEALKPSAVVENSGK